jgi:hypothetical protein
MLKCKCGGEVDVSFADIFFLNENKLSTGVEGLCKKCNSTVFAKYKFESIEIEIEKEYDFYSNGQIPHPV